jgi:probable HAF family extracellular repeat protein
LREASGINDLGQIVGRATVNGQEHAFLLTPIATTTAAVSQAKAQKSGIRPRVDSSFTVTLTNPVNSAQFAAPTNVTIGADVSDSYGNVTQIQFFAGTNLLGTAASSPYSVTWTNAPVGTYALTAIASDDVSLSATSAVVNITVTLPSPSSIKLWLNSSVGTVFSTGTNISLWQDQSGNTNDATQSTSGNQPVLVTNALNGLPVVHFNGTSQYLNLPNVLTGTTQAEAFVVLKVATNAPSNYPTLWRWGTSGPSYALPYPNPSGQIADDFGSTVAHNLGVPAQSLMQYHVYEVAGQSGGWSAWINGALQGSTNASTPLILAFPT